MDPEETLDNRKTVELVWREFVPPTFFGVVTIACVFSSHIVSARRSTAMAAALMVSNRVYQEYRDKVVEKIGERKEEAYRDEILQERVNRDPVSNTTVISGRTNDVLCYDAYTARYFMSSMESLRQAENEVNHKILTDYSASLSDLYDILGLDRTRFSDDVGWNADQLLNLKFSTTMSDDNRPCMVIDFQVAPVRHYHRLV
jgi:hypothetical protein